MTHNLEIIGLGTLQSHDRNLYVQNVIYVLNGRETSTFVYITKWRYDDVADNTEALRNLILKQLANQLEIKLEK